MKAVEKVSSVRLRLLSSNNKGINYFLWYEGDNPLNNAPFNPLFHIFSPLGETTILKVDVEPFTLIDNSFLIKRIDGKEVLIPYPQDKELRELVEDFVNHCRLILFYPHGYCRNWDTKGNLKDLKKIIIAKEYFSHHSLRKKLVSEILKLLETENYELHEQGNLKVKIYTNESITSEIINKIENFLKEFPFPAYNVVSITYTAKLFEHLIKTEHYCNYAYLDNIRILIPRDPYHEKEKTRIVVKHSVHDYLILYSYLNKSILVFEHPFPRRMMID